VKSKWTRSRPIRRFDYLRGQTDPLPAAETAPANSAAYNVSKAALHALVRSVAAEVAEFGITANCVVPSTIDTPANRAAMPKADPARWVPLHGRG
jgi:NAD(P)-dependent dehydrogenase (short-subunit alcohol dehydrogenase family)